MRISEHAVEKQKFAVSVAWFGPPSGTHSSTFVWPPLTNFTYQRLFRLPIEWAMMSTFVAPGLAASSWSTWAPISTAVVLFDWLVLYDHERRADDGQPSAWKRPIIVDHTE